MDKKNIESIVPLLPMQQSFLWHSLNSQTSGKLIQLRCTLSGELNYRLLSAAWAIVTQQFQALRSTVHWQDVPAALQVVHKQVDSSLIIIDRSVHPTLNDYLLDDLQRGLDLNKPLPQRMALYPNHDSSCNVVWSMSHVLLDGWSCAIVINRWIEVYSQLLTGQAAQPDTTLPLSDHLRWFKQQDQHLAEQFWDTQLPARYNTAALPLQPSDTPTSEANASHSVQARLPKADTAHLKQSLQAAGISLNSALQAAFAVILHERDSREPVVFSTTVSGRQIDLADVEKRVGMMINMIPVCIRFSADSPIKQWLRHQQDAFFSSLPHATISAQQIALLRPHNTQVHRSLLVIENQPSVMSTPSVRISDYRSDIVSEFDLTLSIIPGDSLELDLQYDCHHFATQSMEDTLARLIRLLTDLPGLLDQSVHALDHYKAIAVTRLRADASKQEAKKLAEAHPRKQAEPEEAGTRLLHALHDIWCTTLGVREVSLTHSFFDLGGSSLQAVMMFEQIEKSLNLKLPPTTLFSAPTLQMLAAFIEEANPGLPESSVVLIHPRGTLTPLFIPFEQADMLLYQPLLAALGSDQPVYGLRIPQQGYPSEHTLQSLTDQILEIYPVGPCRLAGLSGAGLVAWDLAQRLIAKNRDVDLLALLDSYGPDYPTLKPPVNRVCGAAGGLLVHLFDIAGRALKSIPDRVSRKRVALTPERHSPIPSTSQGSSRFSENHRNRIQQEIDTAWGFVREVSRDAPVSLRLANYSAFHLNRWRLRTTNLRMEFVVFIQGLLIEQANSGAVTGTPSSEIAGTSATGSSKADTDRAHTQFLLNRQQSMYGRLQPYEQFVLYCRARKRPAGVEHDPLVGWKHHIKGPVQVTEIPGNHTTMLKPPHVNHLANAIRQCTERCNTNTASAAERSLNSDKLQKA